MGRPWGSLENHASCSSKEQDLNLSKLFEKIWGGNLLTPKLGQPILMVDLILIKSC